MTYLGIFAVWLGATGKIRSTSAHMCSRGTKGAACTLRQNYEGDGVGKPTTLRGKTVPECCAACTAQKGCAVFVFLPVRQSCFWLAIQRFVGLFAAVALHRSFATVITCTQVLI